MGKQAIRTINMVWLGIVLAIVYWPFEAIVDATLSGEGTFSEHLFTSDLNELWMRIAISTLIIGISIYAHRMISVQQGLVEQTSRLNRLLRFLSEVNQHVQRRRSSQDMFDEICNAAVEFGGFHFAWVGVAEAGRGGIKPVALAACSDACRQSVAQASAGDHVACGMAMQAMAEAKPAYCNELKNSECKAAWRVPLQQSGCQSAAAFPIKLQNKPFAVLVVYTGDAGFFHDKEISILAEAADDISFAITNLKHQDEQQKMQNMLKHIVEGTSGAAGGVFFHELTRHVAAALDVGICFVAELLDGRAQSLAIFKDGDFEDNFAKSVSGSPCEQASEGKMVVIESEVQEKYPGDQWLRDVGAESYICLPFADQSGKVIGYLGIVDRKPMKHTETMLPVLKSFSVRAGVELQRMQTGAVLRGRLEELERFQKATAQREFRIKELRDEIARLKDTLALPADNGGERDATD